MSEQSELTSEIEQIAATYQNRPEQELEDLFEKEWWLVERDQVSPLRGDSQFWKDFRSKMVTEILKNSDVVGATLGAITSQVLTELQKLQVVDLSDFKIPIAILIAIIARAVWHALEQKK
jgi:hypothetical protein